MATSSSRFPARRLDVVVPVWNRERTIERALRSILEQAMGDLTLIVVDDGSEDATRDVVMSISDPRLVLVEQANQGPGAARNRGAMAGSSPWIAFLDSDDEPAPGWAGVLLDHPDGTGIVGCHATYRHADGTTESTHDDRPSDSIRFLPGLFAVRRDLFETVGGYDPALRYSENTELGFRLIQQAQRDGLGTTVHRHAPVTIHLPVEGGSQAFTVERQCAAAESIVVRHYDYLAQNNPRRLGSYLAITGVCALRTGDRPRARRRLWMAVRRAPLSWRYWLRLVQALVGPLPR